MLQQALIDLWYWRRGGDSFNCMIFQLCQKADPGNLRRLETAFPELVEAWKAWKEAPDEDEFFKEHVKRPVMYD